MSLVSPALEGRFFTNCATWEAQNEMLHLNIKCMVWPLLRESRNTRMHTHTHAHAHSHGHTHSHAHTHTCTHMCARTHTCIHMHAHTLTHTHMHTLIHAHTCARTHTCTHIHAHTCAHTPTHSHTCAHTHTHSLRFVLTATPFSALIASEPEGPMPVTQAALGLGPDPTVLGLCEQVNIVYHPTKSISLGDLQGRRWKLCFSSKADTDLLWDRIYSILPS